MYVQYTVHDSISVNLLYEFQSLTYTDITLFELVELKVKFVIRTMVAEILGPKIISLLNLLNFKNVISLNRV